MKSSHTSQPHRSITNLFLCIFICLFVTSIQPASAAPPSFHYHVDVYFDTSINSGCLDEVDDNTCGLRGAISLANSGSSSYYHYIHLPDGTYNLTLPGAGEDSNVIGDLDIYGPTIIIEGTSMYGTIISQAGSFDRIIDHQGNHGLQLINLTIQNGNLPSGYGGGGGVRSLDTDYLTLDNVYFYNNLVGAVLSTDRGGGLYIDNTDLEGLDYTIFRENSACNGGGVAIANSGTGIDTSFVNIWFDTNTATDDPTCGYGGGLYTYGIVNLTLDSPSFGRNHGQIGAAYFDSYDTTAVMTDVMCYENQIDTGGHGTAGMNISGTATISDSMFFSNVALTSSGAMALMNESVVTVEDSRFTNNQGGKGGAIFADYNTSAVLRRVQITTNTASNGGGIYVNTNADIDLENVTIANNHADDFGGGIYLYQNTSANLNHVTVAGNGSDAGGDAVYIDYNGHWYSQNSIYFLAGHADVCEYGSPSYSVGSNSHNIENANSCKLGGLRNTDPLLGDLDAYDSSMLTMPPLPGSPAIDGAIADDPVTTDQRGVIRLDGDGDGLVKSDIGAHETYVHYYFALIVRP